MRIIKKFLKSGKIGKEDNVTSITINDPHRIQYVDPYTKLLNADIYYPELYYDQYYNRDKDGDLYQDYEKLGSLWLNKNNASLYLTDSEMTAKRLSLLYNYDLIYNKMSQMRKELTQQTQDYADLVDMNNAIDKMHRYEDILKAALEAGNKASSEYYNTLLTSKLDDNSDDAMPYINDWKGSNDIRTLTMIKYLLDYQKAHPETDGEPLFTDELFLGIQDYGNLQNKEIDDGVELSRTVPRNILETIYGLRYGWDAIKKGIKWYPVMKSAMLSKASPDVLAGLHGLNAASNGYFGYEAARTLFGEEGAKKTYNLFKQGDYLNATKSGLGDLFNASLLLGTNRIPGFKYIPGLNKFKTPSVFEQAWTSGKRAYEHAYYPRAIANEGFRRFGTTEGAINQLNKIGSPGFNINGNTKSWREWGNEITRMADKYKYGDTYPSLSMPILTGVGLGLENY